MNITIFNGNPDPDDHPFERYVDDLGAALSSRNHQARPITLRDQDVRPCTGCFGCWIKHPGRCMVEDDQVAIRRAYLASDLVLLASPVRMGFYSPTLKRSLDKLLPLLLPYILLDQGECHHEPRYESYPRLGLLLQPGEDTDDEDLEIIQTITRRQALDLKTTFTVALSTVQPVEEVADAIDRL